jgi:organic radical activating enzyme
MDVATVEYNSESVWPGQKCDVLYVEGTPFYEHPRWSPWPALFQRARFNALYDINKNLSDDDFRVITGGEPFLQGVELFTAKLKDAIGCPVRIDTDGAFPSRLLNAIDKELFDHIALRVWAPPSKYESLGLLPKGIIDDSIVALERMPSHEIIIPYDPDFVDIVAIYNDIKRYDIEQITIWPLDSSVERLVKQQSTLTRDDIIQIIQDRLPKSSRITIL